MRRHDQRGPTPRRRGPPNVLKRARGDGNHWSGATRDASAAHDDDRRLRAVVAGGASQVLAVNPDGSWSAALTFSFSGVDLRHTTIDADCLDFNGVTGVAYAHYMDRHAQIFE